MGVVLIDDELLKRVEQIAAERAIPLERQIESLLIDGLRREGEIRSYRTAFDAVAARTPKGVAQTDSVKLLREERDR